MILSMLSRMKYQQRSANIFKSSGSQFFRTITKVQLGVETRTKTRSIMTFLTISGVTYIFCRFRLLLEVTTYPTLPESSILGFSEKILANNYSVSDAEDSTYTEEE